MTWQDDKDTERRAARIRMYDRDAAVVHPTVPKPLKMGQAQGACPTCGEPVRNDHGVWKHR